MDLPLRVGGRLSLDFVNTVEGRGEPDPLDFLPDYAALLTWADSLDVRLPTPIEKLSTIVDDDPSVALSAHRRVVAAREALAAVFAAAGAGASPGVVPAADLELVNAELCEATDHHILRPAPAGGVRDGWLGDDRLESVLWPVMIDAWDVLTTPIMQRVRTCPGDHCGWLFFDESRAGNRRWCDMRTCGNRAKVRNHYSRHN